MLYIDGEVHSQQTLIAALEDGPGDFFLGERRDNTMRYAGIAGVSV